MAVFLFGVAVGWVSTLALWFIWSFGLLSGLSLGAVAGTAAIFAFLIVQEASHALAKSQNRGGISNNKTLRSDPEKAFPQS